MFKALRIDYAIEGLTFLEAGNISLSKTFFSYYFFISDPLLAHGGVSIGTHWIIWELEGNLLKQPLKDTLDQIRFFMRILCLRYRLKITLIAKFEIMMIVIVMTIA